MAFVVTLSNFTPPARFDGIPFVTATIEEAPTSGGPWSPVASLNLQNGPGVSPIGLDNPAAPLERDLTTTLATLDPAVGWFRVVFDDGAQGVAYSDPVGPSGYPTTEALVAASDVPELTGASEEDQDTWRTFAIAAVEGFTGQRFRPVTETRLVAGSGGKELQLPERLESITALSVLGTSLDVTSVTLNDRHDRLLIEPVSTSYAVQAMQDDPWLDTRTFRLGAGTVSITGVWGWAVVPEAVKTALRVEMEDQARAEANDLADTVAAFRRLGMNDVSQGNLRFALTNGVALSYRAQLLLGDYVWHAPGQVV